MRPVSSNQAREKRAFPYRPRFRTPLHRYRVFVTDDVIYAKVFAARSPRHALVLASIDSEQNRRWRQSWDVYGPRPARFDQSVTVEEVRP